MLKAELLLKKNNVNEALWSLYTEISFRPEDSKLRIFLFQLLCIAGDYDKALIQLAILADLDDSMMPMVKSYHPILISERERLSVFQGDTRPTMINVIQGCDHKINSAPKNQTASAFYLSKTPYPIDIHQPRKKDDIGLGESSDLSGTINGSRFDWIIDGDSRVGSSLELMINGDYGWVPFHYIRKIVFEAPRDLRDLVWFPAEITWKNNSQTIAFIPVRYADSTEQKNMSLWSSRSTTWRNMEGHNDAFIGFGQRMLFTQDNEYPLLEIREIIIDDDDT